MRKILVIEDEEFVRENIQEILSLENFYTVVAENGKIGVQLAREELPDLIICDVMMPELDGYDVLQVLRQNEVTATIPLIFLTAKASRSDLRQGMELGADDYLTKPFTPSELLKAITTRFEKQTTVDHQTKKKLDQLSNSISSSLPKDLHAPLNNIIETSKVLIEDYGLLSKSEGLEMLEKIHDCAKGVYRLTKNFLLHAELELIAADSGKIAALRNIHAKSHTQAVITDVALRSAQNAGREKDLSLELKDSIVSISELKLRKVVEELVDNAFKFSAFDTPVHIVSDSNSGSFNLYVIDHGQGMTAKQIVNIGAYIQFESQSREKLGSGLGLTIAKRLVELHRGKLTVESVPGRQTIVQVSLPT
ncbi:MAG: hybrid sensor histidine kinase/response regulator [Elainellaceae cyanobacterium]